MAILSCGPEHVERLTPLFDAYRSFYGRPPDLDGARAFLSARLESGESVVLLAVGEDGGDEGFVQLYPSFSSVRMAPLWILNDLFVVSSRRRGGVGRELMAAATTAARAAGAVAVQLETGKGNRPAKGLYESLGWRLDEEHDRYQISP